MEMPAVNGNRTKTVVKNESESVFNAKEIVQILQNLMIAVTKENVTAQTVQAACQCASQISTLLRIHLEAERLKRSRKE